MNQSKRQLSENVLFDTETKKLRKSTFDKNDRAVTYIEHLSNEIFYEIFDYLDAYDIFYGFSNLNIRFNHLINRSSLPIKIYRSTSFNHISNAQYRQFVIDNRHRIISFYMHDEVQMSSFSLLSMNYTLFSRLESLVLDKIDYNILISLLSNLNILPRLFSLKIDLSYTMINFTELYTLILYLPVLKYNKLSALKMVSNFGLPYITDKFSSIEHLVIHSLCDVDDLLTILSNTPHISHLTCSFLQSIVPIKTKLPLNTFNLKYVSINECHLIFDQFEMLFKNLFSQIQVLCLVISSDNSYIDADRWERLILQYMPHLRILNLTYSQVILLYSTLRPFQYRLSRFISPFWIQRKWFLELKTCKNLFPPTRMTYSIQTLKKQWYELHDDVNVHQMVNCSTLTQQKCIDTSFSRLHLINTDTQSSENYESFKRFIHSIIDLVQFTSLHMDFYQFSIHVLIQFLYLLPNLDSLTITSKFPEATKILSKEQNNMIHFVSTHNKITKLSLEQMTELDQVHILMDLCRNMHYLQVKCRNTVDAEWLIRYVLTKQNTNFIPYLCLLCIWFSTTDDKMVNNLQRIIDTDKLIDNYTIKRICNRIYLRWN